MKSFQAEIAKVIAATDARRPVDTKSRDNTNLPRTSGCSRQRGAKILWEMASSHDAETVTLPFVQDEPRIILNPQPSPDSGQNAPAEGVSSSKIHSSRGTDSGYVSVVNEGPDNSCNCFEGYQIPGVCLGRRRRSSKSIVRVCRSRSGTVTMT